MSHSHVERCRVGLPVTDRSNTHVGVTIRPYLFDSSVYEYFWPENKVGK